MVKGLDDLIRFLVDEIAIFGEQGKQSSAGLRQVWKKMCVSS